MRLLLLLAALLTIFVVPGLCQDAYPVSKEYLIKKLSKKRKQIPNSVILLNCLLIAFVLLLFTSITSD